MLLVVDANILVGELLRVRGRELFEKDVLRLHISEQALDETLHEDVPQGSKDRGSGQGEQAGRGRHAR